MENKTNKVNLNLCNKEFQSDFAKSLQSKLKQSLDLSTFLMLSDKPDDFLQLNNENTAACPNVSPDSIKINQNNEELKEALKRDFRIICLRKEVQALLEENRRLSSSTQSNETSSYEIENECLKMDIHDLEWQLKEARRTNDTYHKLMEDIIRFLDRVRELSKTSTPGNTPGSSPIHSLNGSASNIASSTLKPPLQNVNSSFSGSPMERSKSIHHVHRGGQSPDLTIKMNFTLPHKGKKQESPKKTPSKVCDYKLRELAWLQSKQSKTSPDYEIKWLADEAFRLQKFAKFVMNSTVADLTPSSKRTPTNSLPDDLNKTCSKPKSYLRYGGDSNDAALPNVFTRERNGRDSFSGQSSSSTSSSSKVADETTTRTTENKFKSVINVPTKSLLGTAAVENESGFSSMNSFQELPLVNSTMIERFNESNSTNEDDTTLQPLIYETPFQRQHETNLSLHEVGLPIQTTHRRYDSLPITYEQSDKFQINTEDLRVLWV